MEKLYVLGHPVGHSKSPAMHNAAYRALGLDWSYGLADIADEDEARAFLTTRAWRAVNVTMPWKPLALALASADAAADAGADAAATSDAARLAKGANVLVNWDGRLHADNTDGKGCVAFLRRCGVGFSGARVAVCGTGPTSLAIMHACADAGVAHVALLGRDASKAQHVLDDYLQRAQQDAGATATGEAPANATAFAASSYDAGLELLARATLVVDATPLGMKASDPAPFDTRVLSAGQHVFDVVYGHGKTALVRAAHAAGCRTYDGAGMLVAQAVETVRDIADVTGAFEIPADLDLFAIMASAAGFDFSLGKF